jgi:hypothetical protein
VWRKVGVFLLLMLALSSIFYTLGIAAGSMTAGRMLYAVGLMWCPGLAALATKAIYREPVGELGWGWGQPRYVACGYVLPVAYAVPVYLLVWAATRECGTPDGDQGWFHPGSGSRANTARIIETARQPDGNYALAGELLAGFDRVLRKTVQGLFVSFR